MTFDKLFPNFDWKMINCHMIEDYKEAEKITKTFNAANHMEYESIVNERYKGILPLQPFLKYKDKGWRNWMTFLGNDKIKHKCDITLELFRRYMRIYHPLVNSAKKYLLFYRSTRGKVSNRLPSRPDVTFGLSFSGIFQVKSKRTKHFCTFEHFIKIMATKHKDIIYYRQYKEMAKNGKLDDGFPRNPCNKYKVSWKEILTKIKQYF